MQQKHVYTSAIWMFNSLRLCVVGEKNPLIYLFVGVKDWKGPWTCQAITPSLIFVPHPKHFPTSFLFQGRAIWLRKSGKNSKIKSEIGPVILPPAISPGNTWMRTKASP